MKVSELIYLLEKEDQNAEVVHIGEGPGGRNFYYRIVSLRAVSLVSTKVRQQHDTLTDAFKNDVRQAEDGVLCVELQQG